MRDASGTLVLDRPGASWEQRRGVQPLIVTPMTSALT
jgi:hypothetical protein